MSTSLKDYQDRLNFEIERVRLMVKGVQMAKAAATGNIDRAIKRILEEATKAEEACASSDSAMQRKSAKRLRNALDVLNVFEEKLYATSIIDEDELEDFLNGCEKKPTQSQEKPLLERFPDRDLPVDLSVHKPSVDVSSEVLEFGGADEALAAGEPRGYVDDLISLKDEVDHIPTLHIAARTILTLPRPTTFKERTNTGGDFGSRIFVGSNQSGADDCGTSGQQSMARVLAQDSSAPNKNAVAEKGDSHVENTAANDERKESTTQHEQHSQLTSANVSRPSSNLLLQTSEQIPPGRRVECEILWAENPSLFWIRLKNSDYLAIKEGLSEMIEREGKQPLGSIEIGRYCAVMVGDGYERGKIMDYNAAGGNSAFAKVMLIDRGLTDQISITLLFELPELFLRLRRQSIPCRLSEVAPRRGYWNNDNILLFRILCTTETPSQFEVEFITTHDRGINEVRLYRINEPGDGERYEVVVSQSLMDVQEDLHGVNAPTDSFQAEW